MVSVRSKERLRRMKSRRTGVICWLIRFHDVGNEEVQVFTFIHSPKIERFRSTYRQPKTTKTLQKWKSFWCRDLWNKPVDKSPRLLFYYQTLKTSYSLSINGMNPLFPQRSWHVMNVDSTSSTIFLASWKSRWSVFSTSFPSLHIQPPKQPSPNCWVNQFIYSYNPSQEGGAAITLGQGPMTEMLTPSDDQGTVPNFL